MYPDYHHSIMEPEDLNTVILNIKRYLKLNSDVVAVAGCGLSGIPIVAIIARLTGIAPIYIRRIEEESHDKEKTNTRLQKHAKLAGRYVILDDLIATGMTVRHIESCISRILGLSSIPHPKPSFFIMGHQYYSTIRDDPPHHSMLGWTGMRCAAMGIPRFGIDCGTRKMMWWRFRLFQIQYH